MAGPGPAVDFILVTYLYALCNFNSACLAQWIRNSDFMTHCSSSQVLSERKFFISGSWPSEDGRGRRKWKLKWGWEAQASSAVVKITATRKTASWTTATLLSDSVQLFPKLDSWVKQNYCTCFISLSTENYFGQNSKTEHLRTSSWTLGI